MFYMVRYALLRYASKAFSPRTVSRRPHSKKRFLPHPFVVSFFCSNSSFCRELEQKKYRTIQNPIPPYIKIALVIVSTITISSTFCSQNNQKLTLNLRTRVKQSENNELWREQTIVKNFDPSNVAFLICDLWDKHWCKTLSERVSKIAAKAGPIVESLRERGAKIIHAPSDCMNFYGKREPEPLGAPQEKRQKNFPIDDSIHCPDSPRCKEHIDWTREHPAIRIAQNDLVTTDPNEIFNFLQTHNIKLVIMIGVHVNCCVLGRPFGIEAMKRRGVPVVLVRDLTDVAYSPKSPPFVSLDEATEIVVQWIEKHYCPSIKSTDL